MSIALAGRTFLDCCASGGQLRRLAAGGIAPVRSGQAAFRCARPTEHHPLKAPRRSLCRCATLGRRGVIRFFANGRFWSRWRRSSRRRRQPHLATAGFFVELSGTQPGCAHRPTGTVDSVRRRAGGTARFYLLIDPIGSVVMSGAGAPAAPTAARFGNIGQRGCGRVYHFRPLIHHAGLGPSIYAHSDRWRQHGNSGSRSPMQCAVITLLDGVGSSRADVTLGFRLSPGGGAGEVFCRGATRSASFCSYIR